MIAASWSLAIRLTKAGDEIDKAMGWQKHPEKLACFANKPAAKQALRKHAELLGTETNRFKLVGVWYQMKRADGSVYLDSSKLQAKVDTRLKRISMAGKDIHQRARLVKKLILPMIRYTGAWNRPTKEALNKWTSSIERTVVGTLIRGRSPFLIWTTLLGPELHPRFALNCEALRHEQWRTRQALQFKLDTGRPLESSKAGRWMQTCKEWDWHLTDEVGVAETRDGQIHLASAGKPAIAALCRRAFGEELWKTDKRCMEDFPDDLTPCTQVHNNWCKTATASWNMQRIKVATGASFDHKVAQKLTKTTHTCMCGIEDPDREHWMWYCPSLDGPAPIGRRSTLAERKLAIPLEPRGRNIMAMTLPLQTVRTLAKYIRQQAQGNSIHVFIATDGGATNHKPANTFNRHAGWGAAMFKKTTRRTDFNDYDGTKELSDSQLRAFHTVEGTVPGLDSSAFAAELFAAECTATAAAMAAEQGFDIKLTWFIDNLSVCKMVQEFAKGKKRLPAQYALQHYWLAKALKIVEVDAKWIPSHGKTPDWKNAGDEGLTTGQARALNAAADVGASRTAVMAWKKSKACGTTALSTQTALQRLCLGTQRYVDKVFNGCPPAGMMNGDDSPLD